MASDNLLAEVPESTGSTLRVFLEDPRRPPDTLTYHELQGFLFAVASAPELVKPSEWLPIVFGEQNAGYADLEEAQAVIGELMGLYNSVNAAVFEKRAALPSDCRLRRQALANFEHDAPVAQWSRGFLKGHQWVEESWRAHFPAQAYEQLTALLVTLTFFAYSKKEVEAVFGERARTDLAVLAATVVDIFPEALGTYAYFGRRLQQVIAEARFRRLGKSVDGRVLMVPIP